jgi:single-strand DNA-binding protein
MNNLKNRVTLIGNLGCNPDCKVLDSGTKMARVSLGTTDTFQNAKGERVSETHWHNIIGWGKVAQILETHTKVGSKIAVEGRLINRQYTDKGGNKRLITEVHINEIILLTT